MGNTIVQATWPTECKTESKRYYKARRVRKIRNKELASFSLRLAAMLEAGLPVAQCIDALAEQTEMNDFRRVLLHIRQRIEAGDTFKEALQRHEYLFGELFISMVDAGETGGTLAEVMAQLGKHLEAAAALRRRVLSAMTYPVVVLIMSIVLTGVATRWPRAKSGPAAIRGTRSESSYREHFHHMPNLPSISP